MAKSRGRPPRNAERATKRIEAVLTLDEYRDLAALVQMSGTQATVADVIRALVADAAEEAGIVAGKNSRPVRQ
jgi:hypothetical protein